jgi:hypothetical protein
MQISFEKIEEKIKLLLVKLENTQYDLDVLQKENEQLKNQLFIQNEEIKSFKNREKISKIVEGVTGSNEKGAHLKQKINEYIKEIDKCIAYLS